MDPCQMEALAQGWKKLPKDVIQQPLFTGDLTVTLSKGRMQGGPAGSGHSPHPMAHRCPGTHRDPWSGGYADRPPALGSPSWMRVAWRRLPPSRTPSPALAEARRRPHHLLSLPVPVAGTGRHLCRRPQCPEQRDYRTPRPQCQEGKAGGEGRSARNSCVAVVKDKNQNRDHATRK